MGMEEIVTEFSNALVEEIFKMLGINYTKADEKRGEFEIYKFFVGTDMFSMLVEEHRMVLLHFFKGENVNLDDINRWNQERSLCIRSFLDDDGDIGSDYFIFCDGGVTKKHIHATVAGFVSQVCRLYTEFFKLA